MPSFGVNGFDSQPSFDRLGFYVTTTLAMVNICIITFEIPVVFLVPIQRSGDIAKSKRLYVYVNKNVN